MKNFSALLLLFLFLVGSPAAFSQSAAGDDEAQIRSLLQEYAATVDGLSNIQETQKLKTFLTPNYAAIRTDYLVDGTYAPRSITLEEMNQRAASFTSDMDHTVSFKIDNISYLKVLSGKTAVVCYTASFSTSNKGEKMFGGTQVVTSRLVKTDAGWKLHSSHIAEVRDDVQSYLCNYELFTKDKDTYVVKLFYPMGTYFEEDFLNLKYESIGPNAFMINTGQEKIRWDGSRLYFNEGAQNPHQVSATNRDAVIEAIIQHNFPQQCSNVQKAK